MRSRREEGFTLIEAMIAALVLLIAIVFVAQVFVTAMQQNKSSRQFTHTTAIAQSKLEELNALPLEEIRYGGDLGARDVGEPGAPGYFDYVTVDGVDRSQIGVVVDREQANYVRYWRIDPDPEGWSGIYRITVRVVSLRPGQGTSPEETVLSTIRSQF